MWTHVGGGSLTPLLRAGDAVLVERCVHTALSPGDIAVGTREDGGLVAHLVESVGPVRTTAFGGAADEPPLRPLGRVVSFKRGGVGLTVASWNRPVGLVLHRFVRVLRQNGVTSRLVSLRSELEPGGDVKVEPLTLEHVPGVLAILSGATPGLRSLHGRQFWTVLPPGTVAVTRDARVVALALWDGVEGEPPELRVHAEAPGDAHARACVEALLKDAPPREGARVELAWTELFGAHGFGVEPVSKAHGAAHGEAHGRLSALQPAPNPAK